MQIRTLLSGGDEVVPLAQRNTGSVTPPLQMLPVTVYNETPGGSCSTTSASSAPPRCSSSPVNSEKLKISSILIISWYSISVAS